MILGVYQVPPYHHEWPCPPCLWSGTLNILQVLSFLTPHSWHPSMKISTQNFQDILLLVKQDHIWHQRLPCHPSLWSGTINVSKYHPTWPDILYTLLIQISTQNFQGIFHRVKQGHLWHRGWPSPPSLWPWTLNILQVSHFCHPNSWHISNENTNTKISEYLP